VYQPHPCTLYNQFLFSESQRDRFDIVLVSPRNPLNIGAAARAMANFGFSRLAVVDPYEPHWREAKSAIGAENLLKNARRTETLADAVSDCTLVIGTGTLTHRKPEQPVVPLPSLANFIDSKSAPGARIALVFGPEKRGLTRDDLALCHLLVEIPTDPRQPSMNLGQAVAVCLYELAALRGEPSRTKPDPAGPAATLGLPDPNPPATAHDLDLLAAVIGEAMAAANYSPSAMQKANRHDLELLLRRLALTRRDARRILGLFRRVLWKLHHRGSRL
jgi:TrmH family RNA methyltransferase